MMENLDLEALMKEYAQKFDQKKPNKKKNKKNLENLFISRESIPFLDGNFLPEVKLPEGEMLELLREAGYDVVPDPQVDGQFIATLPAEPINEEKPGDSNWG